MSTTSDNPARPGSPVLREDLHRLLDRIEHLRRLQAGCPAVLTETAAGSLRRVMPFEVIRLRAAGRRTVLSTSRGDVVWRGGLGVIVAHWRLARIVRCHRSFAVNLDCVRAIEWLPSGAGRISLSDGSIARLGRTWRSNLLHQLGRNCAGQPQRVGPP